MHADLLERFAQQTGRGRGRLGHGTLQRNALGVGPRLVAVGNALGPLGGQEVGEMGENGCGCRVARPVVGLDGVGVEVVELPLVGEGLRSVDRPGRSASGQMAHARLGPGVGIVEGPHDLPQAAGTASCCGIRHPDDETLEVGGDVGGHLDAQREWRTHRPAHLPGHRAGPGVALGHVVAGQQVDRPFGVGRRRPVDHRHEIAAGKGVYLGVGLLELPGGFLLVDAGGGQQRRHEIDMGARSIVDLAARRLAVSDPGDGERHPGGLVIQVEPFLVEAAVGAQQLAVVGGSHQHGVL